MKKRIIILGSVVIAVIVLWSAAWIVVSGIVRDTIAAQATADGVETPRLTCGELQVGGYPFRFDVDCSQAQVAMGDVAVNVPGLRASIRVYAPTHLLASALGPLQLTDSFTGTRNSLAWSRLEASIRLDDWRIARASISGRDLVWSDALFGDATIAQASLAELHIFDMAEQHDPERGVSALSIYGRAQELAWPGLTLADANAEIELEATGLPDDVRNWSEPPLLLSMQRNGGVLRVVSVAASDASSTLSANGELGLDDQGLVEGQLSIASTGVAERIGPFIDEPWRTLVLGLPGPDGSHANQLNFGGGTLSSGMIPIATLPPLF